MRRLLLAALALQCSAAVVIRQQCGAAAPAADQAGVTWAADAFGTGGWTMAAAGPDVPYRALRYGPAFAYTYQLAPGIYRVTLRFLEPVRTAAGARLFSVTANGQAALTKLDVYAAAGGQLKPIERTFPVVTPAGKIALEFAGVVGNAVVSGIVIEDAAAGVAISLDGHAIGSYSAVNLVTGPGITPLVSARPDGGVDVQLGLALATLPPTVGTEQTDTFSIACSGTVQNCVGGNPTKSFMTSKVPRVGDVCVYRNGMLLTQGSVYDYSIALPAGGPAMVTLTNQATADGDVVTLRYVY